MSSPVVDALLDAVRESGQVRLRALRHDFSEIDFLAGAASVLNALIPGPVVDGQPRQSPAIPVAWTFLVPVGRSWVDPDDVIFKSLGLHKCIYCSKPGTKRLNDERFCEECYEEVREDR